MITEKTKRIIQLFKQGHTQTEIAKMVGLTKSRIGQIIINNKVHKPRPIGVVAYCERCKIELRGKEKQTLVGHSFLCKPCRKKVIAEKLQDYHNYKFDTPCKECGKKPLMCLGLCSTCYLRDIYKRSPKKRATIKKSSEKWRKNNPDKIKAIRRKCAMVWYSKNKEKAKETSRKRYLAKKALINKDLK